MATTDRLLPLEDGPWTGMHDSAAPTARVPGKYQYGRNIYPLDPSSADGVVGRPGVSVLGAQLGAVGVRRVQAIGQFTKKNGTEYTVAIVGGKFYTIDWNTSTWTEVLTAANLTTATVTLSTTAKVALHVFKDSLIVSDGVNIPWAWDGTSGGGITKLTNAPVLYGQPWTYEGRWFGFKASDPTTIVWSEADVLNTGFEAGGFNNAWSVTQTNPNRFYAAVGTESGIILLRARSTTVVAGDVGPSFASTSTTEAIDDAEGTLSPFAVVHHDTGIVLLDAELHPMLARFGASGMVPLWAGFRETLRRVPRSPAMAALCMGLYYAPAQLILFAVPDVGATECNLVLVLDAKASVPTPVAVWGDWGDIAAMAMVKNQSSAQLGQPYWLHGSTDGYVYLHGNPEDALPWDDGLASGTVPISHELECQPLGFSVAGEKIFDRIDLSLRSTTTMTLAVAVATPRGLSTPQSITVGEAVLGWDTALWDDMDWNEDAALGTEEVHGDVGLDEQGRWVKPVVTHAQLGEQFGLVALSVTAYPTDDDPEIP